MIMEASRQMKAQHEQSAAASEYVLSRQFEVK